MASRSVTTPNAIGVMTYRAPKQIISHPAVAECDSGHDGGSDYKHDVLLRDGYVFTRGRMSGGRCGFFHTVADFKYARPLPSQTQ